MSTTTVASGGTGRPPRGSVVALVAAPFAVVLLVALIALVVVGSLRGVSGPDEPAARDAARTPPPYWTVKAGDSYSSIAAKTGLTVEDLETFNPRQDPAGIRAGQHLRLRLHPPPLHPKVLGPRTAVVRTGDSYSSIAERTGHDMRELQRLNPSVPAAALQPGQRIRLRP